MPRILYPMKRALKITGVTLGIVLVILLAMLLYYLGVTANVRLDRDKLTMSTACVRLYDGYGEEIPVSVRTDAAFETLPEHVGQAFVAVEDKRFYEHGGIDTRRVFAALWHNLTSFSFREGASTISQQLIKNTHLSSEKTIQRKLKELKLARILEKHYSKEQILALYLNSIYFGHSAFGIENAAQFYFGKHAEALDAAESAMLAAIVRSPNRYSPFRDAGLCLSRRNLVLRLMKEQGYLTEDACLAAQQEPLPAQPAQEQTQNAYLACVLEELAELFPDAKSGDWGALEVFTYYDPELQETLDRIDCESDFCALVRDNAQNALLALSSTAGTPKRSPASTIKPLLVYAPALQENLINPATPVLDARTDFGGYSPDDYGGATGEYMSVRHALSRSVNIPAVKILNELGIARGADYLARMDLAVDDADRSLALALGGMREGFTLPALADGYATFASGGTFTPSAAIERVTDGKGRILYERNIRRREVFSEDVSWLINDMLMTTAREGTAKRLKSLPFPVCAKTGTAGTDAGNTDAYCIGYTRDHVVGVWMGNEDYTPVQASGGGLPANETLRILRGLYKDGAPSLFPACDGVTELHYDKEAYETDHTVLLSDPAAPPYTDPKEYFRLSAPPLPVSTRYSLPSIKTPAISVQNGTVKIVLCQTEYYDYEIIRENRGKKATIYCGKYRNTICDNSVRAGETYVYTVLPKYKEHTGTPVVLPSVTLPSAGSIPDNWWRTQCSGMRSSVASASATRPSISSFFSSSSIKESLGLIAGYSGRNTVQQSS